MEELERDGGTRTILGAGLGLRALYREQPDRLRRSGALSFLGGAALLSLVAWMQRLAHGFSPDTLSAYVLPFLVGGLGGLSLGLGYYRLRAAIEASRQSEAGFRALAESSPDGIALCHGERFLWGNPAWLALLGVSSLEQLKALSFSAFVPPREIVALQAYLHAALNRRPRDPWVALTLCRADGGQLAVELAASMPFEYQGRTVLQLVLRDLSARKASEDRLRQAAAVFESTSEGVMITDRSGVISDVNHAFTRITGYPRHEVLGQNPRLLQSGRHDAAFYRNMWHAILRQGDWQGKIWNRRRNGEIYPQWTTISTLKDPHSNETQFYVALFSDISHIEESRRQLSYLEHHDALTGLANRLLLQARLAHALERARHQHQRLVVFWLDLDRFHFINNALGHKAADELLCSVAQRLNDYMRELGKEYTAARTGGDEFVVVLEDVAETRGIALIAQHILTGLSFPVRLAGQEAMLTVSLGISVYPEDGEDGEVLLQRADAAMSRAKQQGGNNYQFFEIDLSARVFEHLRLENSLWQALEHREFVLYYQPQISLHNGLMIGAEALIRWRHPEHGLVYPGKFIHLVEETALSDPLSDWTLRTACMQNKRWQAAGHPPIRVGVNLSARQIAQENILEKVTAILHETRLDPHWLKLEVTESLILENPELAIINLQSLKKLGVSLSLDDFGTGYSSFSYLKQLPIDELKIDRSFVQDIPGESKNCKITPAIIDIGHSLELKVMAEGVETVEQLEFLKAHGCDTIQGYLFSEPIPAEELAGLFGLDFLTYRVP